MKTTHQADMPSLQHASRRKRRRVRSTASARRSRSEPAFQMTCLMGSQGLSMFQQRNQTSIRNLTRARKSQSATVSTMTMQCLLCRRPQRSKITTLRGARIKRTRRVVSSACSVLVRLSRTYAKVKRRRQRLRWRTSRNRRRPRKSRKAEALLETFITWTVPLHGLLVICHRFGSLEKTVMRESHKGQGTRKRGEEAVREASTNQVLLPKNYLPRYICQSLLVTPRYERDER